jgi:hypothetical protein
MKGHETPADLIEFGLFPSFRPEFGGIGAVQVFATMHVVD